MKIKTDKDYEKALKEVEKLMNTEMDKKESDKFNMLVGLIVEYEKILFYLKE